MKRIWRLLMKMTGWKIIGDLPADLNKFIIAVAPHTSNRDFFIGVMVRGYMGFKANFLAKNSLFKFPLGIFFRQIGGIAVDRSQSSNMVDLVAELAKKKDSFILAVAPEGTRKKVSKWRTGFYYIAYKAEIPIILCQMDWRKKEVRFLSPFFPSGNIEKDLPELQSKFTDVYGYADL